MKILMVAYTEYLSDARPRREAEALASRGDEVDFVALAERDKPLMETVAGVNLFRTRVQRFRGSNNLAYVLAYLKFFVAAHLMVWRLARKKRYSIVQVHTMPDFLVFAAIIPKLQSAKIVLDVHDAMPELYATKFGVPMTHWLIRLITLQERLSAAFADRILAVHEPHKRMLVSHGIPASKITCIMNVPDEKLFRNGDRGASKECFLVYHGTLAYRFGLDLAVRAFVKVKNSVPGAKFRIFGDGDYLPELKNLIRELKLDDDIFLSGKMHPVDEIPNLIKDAALAVIPNRKDAFTDKILPVKLLEYVTMGIPVVITRTSAVEEYFHGSLLYIESGDVEGLANAMIGMLKNPSLREQYAENASAFNERFNWSQQKSTYFSLLDSLK
jgi:glycosyltransferase involved in cell wall biosynthesis